MPRSSAQHERTSVDQLIDPERCASFSAASAARSRRADHGSETVSETSRRRPMSVSRREPIGGAGRARSHERDSRQRSKRAERALEASLTAERRKGGRTRCGRDSGRAQPARNNNATQVDLFGELVVRVSQEHLGAGFPGGEGTHCQRAGRGNHGRLDDHAIKSVRSEIAGCTVGSARSAGRRDRQNQEAGRQCQDSRPNGEHHTFASLTNRQIQSLANVAAIITQCAGYLTKRSQSSQGR
jgi:hypothetical protein